MKLKLSEYDVFVKISEIILGLMQRKVKKKKKKRIFYSFVTKFLFIQTHRVFALCLNIHNI
jgi:hypothetical protein